MGYNIVCRITYLFVLIGRSPRSVRNYPHNLVDLDHMTNDPDPARRVRRMRTPRIKAADQVIRSGIVGGVAGWIRHV